MTLDFVLGLLCVASSALATGLIVWAVWRLAGMRGPLG